MHMQMYTLFAHTQYLKESSKIVHTVTFLVETDMQTGTSTNTHTHTHKDAIEKKEDAADGKEKHFFIQVQSVCKADERAMEQVAFVSSIETGHDEGEQDVCVCIELRERQLFFQWHFSDGQVE